MSHDHNHAILYNQNKRYLWIAFVLTSTYLLVEVAGGLITGSLALLSDAAHMLTDASALAISLTAFYLSARPANLRKTFGYHRFEILAAAFNAILLFFVALYIVYEAYQRLYEPTSIQTTGMFVIAAIGLVINLISMKLLASGKDKSLNVKSAYLEVWSDMLGSLGVLVGAVLIFWTGYEWIDSLIALAIGFWVLPRTWILLKETINILLEGVPEGMNIDEIQAEMCRIPGIVSIHEFHLWALTSGKFSLTAHVVYDSNYNHSEQLLPSLNDLMATKFAIYHTTFQFESNPCDRMNNGCSYSKH